MVTDRRDGGRVLVDYVMQHLDEQKAIEKAYELKQDMVGIRDREGYLPALVLLSNLRCCFEKRLKDFAERLREVREEFLSEGWLEQFETSLDLTFGYPCSLCYDSWKDFKHDIGFTI